MQTSTPVSRAKVSAVLVLLLVLPVGLAPVRAEDPEETPVAVAKRFLRAFEQKDFQAIRTLFAPNAVVASTLLSASGRHELDYKPLEDWIKEAEQEVAQIQDFKIEPLEDSVLSFATGAAVSIRFHSSGRVGKTTFVTEGVDTYAMVRVDGAWRILRYSYIEQMKIG